MKEDTIRKQKYVPFNLIACTGSHPLELHSPTSFVNVSHRVYFFAIAFPAAIIPTFTVITCMCVHVRTQRIEVPPLNEHGIHQLGENNTP